MSCAETVRDCIKLVLSHLEMPAADAGAFRLWVKTGASDESPYPLFGHELPFAIKMNCIREFVNNDDGFDLDHCNNIYSADPATRCQFILRFINILFLLLISAAGLVQWSASLATNSVVPGSNPLPVNDFFFLKLLIIS